jgi:hypothetical protein
VKVTLRVNVTLDIKEETLGDSPDPQLPLYERHAQRYGTTQVSSLDEADRLQKMLLDAVGKSMSMLSLKE